MPHEATNSVVIDAREPAVGPVERMDSSRERTAFRAPDRPTMHFRRIYSPLSETFIREPLQDMVDRGHRLCVLCLIRALPSTKALPVTGLIPFRGILRSAHRLRHRIVKQVGLSDPDTLIWPLLRPLLLVHAWFRRPRLIHAHFGPDGCLIAPIARRLRVPLVVNFYGYDVSRIIHTDGEHWRRRYAPLFRQASALVAISEHIAGKLLELGAPAEKIRVIPLGIRTERFAGLSEHRLSREQGLAGVRPPIVRCLHIGRLTPKKHPIATIKAFALARQSIAGTVELQLDIVGDGPLLQECHQIAKEFGCAGAIVFHGSMDHSRIPGLLAEIDIYTQHSVTAPDGDMEGLGVTFMEASAAGLPIVGTLHDGIPEVVAQGETGFLVPEHDIDAMADAIARLACDPALRQRMGRAGMARVAEHFTADLTIRRSLALHEEITAAWDTGPAGRGSL